MPPELIRSSILNGQKALIVGVANDRSIAWGCAQAMHVAGAAAAGVVLGARVPIILTSRADSVITRLASCAVASLVAEARRKSAAAAIR